MAFVVGGMAFGFGHLEDVETRPHYTEVECYAFLQVRKIGFCPTTFNTKTFCVKLCLVFWATTVLNIYICVVPMIVLPRQARDKHRGKHSQKHHPFSFLACCCRATRDSSAYPARRRTRRSSCSMTCSPACSTAVVTAGGVTAAGGQRQRRRQRSIRRVR